MKKIIQNIFWKIKYEIGDIKEYFYNKKLKKLYPDYKDDEYNCGSLKQYGGIKSWDDTTDRDCSLYTMNDIDITYDREAKEYMLDIETAYIFKDKIAECEYLKKLLNAFTDFMAKNNYSTNDKYCLSFSNLSIQKKAKTIE